MTAHAPLAKERGRARHQVWLLGWLGLGTSLSMLLLVSLALHQMHNAEDTLTRAQASNKVLSDAVDAALTSAQIEQLALLGNEDASDQKQVWQGQLTSVLHQTQAGKPKAEIATAIRSLESALPELAQVSQYSLQWNKSYRRNHAELEAARLRIESNLQEMRALLTSTEGRQQLKVSALFRRFRSATPGPDAHALARDAFSQINSGDDISEFRVELGNLAYVCQRLLNEERLDQLTDYKDNLLSTPLFHLTRNCANLSAGNAEFAAKAEPQLSALKENLLGHDHRMDIDHQSIVLGTGSLLALCQERLLLERERTALRQAFAQNLETVHRKTDRLQQALNALSHELAADAEQALFGAWRSTLLLGLLCTVAFVILARRVAGTIDRQMNTIEQTNLALETTAHDARQKADSLRESEQRTRLIVDTAHDAVVLMDSAGLILDWNTQAEQIFGWSRSEALGRRLSETIIPPQFRALHEAGLKKFLGTGECPILGTRFELPLLRRDESEFPAELAVNPLKLGETWEFSAFIRDISERRQAEADLIQARDAAEHARIEAEQLAEEARAANLAKSEFLAVMSHEIRTPLNGVIGMNELLLNSRLDSAQRKWATMLRTSGHALLVIINDILDFSKIEAGKIDLEKAPFDPRQTAQEVVDMLTPKAAEKQIGLVLRVAPEIPACLLGDVTRFRQIMVNLTGNAVKFTGQGKVAVSLSWATADSVRAKGPDQPSAAASHLAVRVTDTGIGIAPEKLSRLFQSFSQADNSTTRKYGGTGLGLAISKRLVECMGGQIGVESTEGQGSTFWFTLPLSAAVATAPVIETAAPAKQPDAGPAVLLVDDNEINILLGEEMLHQLGCTVTTATNGREALDRLEQKKVAMIFMDCRMPVMDGFTATGEIRRQEAIRGATRIPIVALTANAVDGDRGKCLAAGMDDYLSKPFALSDLKLVIERWTKPQPARATLAR